MDQTVTAAIYNANGKQVSQTMTYSIESYAASRMGSSNPPDSLLIAMVNLGKSAKPFAK